MTGAEPDPDVAPVDRPASRVRSTIEWVVMAVLAGAVVFGCTTVNSTDPATPPPTSSQISGQLGTTVDRVVGGLDDKQKDCIQKETGGPAAAASNCVDRTVLAKQVIDQIKAMGVDDKDFLDCVQKSVEGLSNADLLELAGGTSSAAMSTLSADISSCMGSARPTSAPKKFSSVASAIQ